MRCLRFIWYCGLGLCLAGCAAYKLGPTAGFPAGARSVEIHLFENATMEPRLIEAVGTALRRSVQQDGTFRLDTAGEGDLILTGIITKFDRSGLSYQSHDTLSMQDETMTMTAHVTVRERSTGKLVMENDVTGRTTVRIGPNQAGAERQAIPLMAADLARNATTLLADGPIK